MGGNHQGQGSGDGFGGQVDTQCFLFILMKEDECQGI